MIPAGTQNRGRFLALAVQACCQICYWIAHRAAEQRSEPSVPASSAEACHIQRRVIVAESQYQCDAGARVERDGESAERTEVGVRCRRELPYQGDLPMRPGEGSPLARINAGRGGHGRVDVLPRPA